MTLLLRSLTVHTAKTSSYRSLHPTEHMSLPVVTIDLHALETLVMPPPELLPPSLSAPPSADSWPCVIPLII